MEFHRAVFSLPVIVGADKGRQMRDIMRAQSVGEASTTPMQTPWWKKRNVMEGTA